MGPHEYENERVPEAGCTDPSASNYDEGAEEDDGSCEYENEPVHEASCTDTGASKSDAGAAEDDGSCEDEYETVENGTGAEYWRGEVGHTELTDE